MSFSSPDSVMAGPRPVVLSGPSGAGKSTLLKRLMRDYEGVFGFSVSRMYPSVPTTCHPSFPHTHRPDSLSAGEPIHYSLLSPTVI